MDAVADLYELLCRANARWRRVTNELHVEFAEGVATLTREQLLELETLCDSAAVATGAPFPGVL